MFTRIIIVVLDSVGIGALPDAEQFGDFGVNTLANIAKKQNGLQLPVLAKLGLGRITALTGVPAESAPIGMYGKMAEISKGKDTISGHWEMAGCPLFQAFPVYPQGFPPDLLAAFTAQTGLSMLGNKAASGTEIIAELGEEHLRTGQPIVYTSADSVLQIAAHEEVIPLARLYELCQIVRKKVCVGEHAVGRIIARPFLGEAGNFVRTANRHDYSLEPVGLTVLDQLKSADWPVIGVGKISDIFAARGLTKSVSTRSNQQGMEVLLDLAGAKDSKGLLMVNLVEFDSLYGHRNDIAGYARELEWFDGRLGELLPRLQDNDLLLITADHGCDPTVPGTDHTREYVPLLAYAPVLVKKNKPGISLGVRSSFADIGATVAANFALPPLAYGQSFLPELITGK